VTREWAMPPLRDEKVSDALRPMSVAMRQLDMLLLELSGTVDEVGLQVRRAGGQWMDVEVDQARTAAARGVTVRGYVVVRGEREDELDARDQELAEKRERLRKQPTEVHAGLPKAGQFIAVGEI
jgi:hypothetical protein